MLIAWFAFVDKLKPDIGTHSARLILNELMIEYVGYTVGTVKNQHESPACKDSPENCRKKMTSFAEVMK